MDEQVGFSLSWRWLAAFQRFSVAEIAGVGSLAAPFSVLRRLQCPVAAPAFGEFLESSSPVHSNQTQISFALPTLLNCQPSVKPLPPASLSSIVSVFVATKHFAAPVPTLSSCYQSSASFSASFEGVTWSVNHLLDPFDTPTLVAPPESTPAPFSSDILQPNGLLQQGPQPYLLA